VENAVKTIQVSVTETTEMESKSISLAIGFQNPIKGRMSTAVIGEMNI